MNIIKISKLQFNKSKIPRILLGTCMFLIILMAQFTTSNILQAKAAEATIEGTEWVKQPGGIYWGGSAERQGVLFYLYNVESGNAYSCSSDTPPFVFMASDISNGEFWQDICNGMKVYDSRKGTLTVDRITTRSDFPYPATYTEDGSWISTGGDTKAYLEEETDTGVQRWEEIVNQYWPASKIEEIKKDRTNKYRICIESVSAFVPYKSTSSGDYAKKYSELSERAGDYFRVMTTNKYAPAYFNVYNIDITKRSGTEEAPGTANSGWLQSIANGMVFTDEEDSALLDVPIASYSSAVSSSQMREKGYGFGTIKPTLTPIHTCNGHTPGDPEEPIPDVTDGECTIQKVYWTTYYDKDGNFLRRSPSINKQKSGTTNYIVIDSERGYTVKKWGTSSGSINPTPENWEGFSGTHNGKGGGSITLDDEHGEKYLAVWLEKTVVDRSENKPYDYIIPESQITKRISLDHPDNLRSDRSIPLNTISSHVFEFKADSVSCTDGHTVEEPCTIFCDPPTCTPITNKKGKVTGYKCDGHSGTKEVTKNCSGGSWSDNDTKIGLINELSDSSPSILSKIQQCSLSEKGDTISPTGNTKNLTTTRSGTDAASLSYSGYSFNSIIFRGKDQLVLADWKNEASDGEYLAAKEFLGNISTNSSYNFKSANTPAGTRYHGNFYYDKFGVNFTNGGNGEQDEDTKYTFETDYGCGSKSSSFSLSNPLSINDIIAKVEVYWGEGDGVSGSTGSSELYAGTVSFTPYILMRYDTETQRNKHTFVLSEHPRSITVYDR